MSGETFRIVVGGAMATRNDFQQAMLSPSAGRARMCVWRRQSKSVCVEATFARRPPQFGCREIKTRRCPGGTRSGAGLLWFGAALNPDPLMFSSYSRLYLGPPSVLSFH